MTDGYNSLYRGIPEMLLTDPRVKDCALRAWMILYSKCAQKYNNGELYIRKNECERYNTSYSAVKEGLLILERLAYIECTNKSRSKDEIRKWRIDLGTGVEAKPAVMKPGRIAQLHQGRNPARDRSEIRPSARGEIRPASNDSSEQRSGVRIPPDHHHENTIKKPSTILFESASGLGMTQEEHDIDDEQFFRNWNDLH